MMYDDVCMMMYDDVCMMMYDDVYMMYIWCIYDVYMMMYGDVWWCMMVFFSYHETCGWAPAYIAKGIQRVTLDWQGCHVNEVILQVLLLKLRNWPKAWWLPAVYILPLDRPGSICHAWCWTIQVWGCKLEAMSDFQEINGNQMIWICSLSLLLASPFLPATLRFFYRAYAYIKEKWQPKLSPVDGPFQQQSFPTWMSISY